MPVDECADVRFQLLRRDMDAATNLLRGKFGKPALDLIDPRRRCWRELHVVMWPSRQPGFDHRCFVSGVIVHDDMDVETLRNTSVDLLQELQELGSSMALVAFADHKAGSDIEGRKQRRCAVADIGVSAALWNARHHRQDRLLAIEGLYLALLVDAQHQRPVGRRQIKTNNVAGLVDEQRSLESLNVSVRCGCKPKAFQLLRIAVCEKPVAVAIERIDQWLHPLAWIGACARLRRRPDHHRLSEAYLHGPHPAALRCGPFRKRRPHVPTECSWTPSSLATDLLGTPSAHQRITRQRFDKDRATRWRRTCRSRYARSSELRIKGAIGQPVALAIASPPCENATL